MLRLLVLLPAILLLGSATLCYTEGINILPTDAAGQAKGCSWRGSWHASNLRKGYKGDAATDEVAFNDYADAFKKKMEGILSEETCNDIKWMFWNAAWYTANTRWLYYGDAQKDKERMEKHYDNIVGSGEVSSELASNLKNMGLAAAWYCANTRVGYYGDAKGDKARFDSYSKKIGGKVNLVGMNFFQDRAVILDEPPLVVHKQTLPNYSDLEQKLTFQFTVSDVTTTTFSQDIGFEHSQTVGFSAGFKAFGVSAETKYEASFTFSVGVSLSESFESGQESSYTFELTAAPHSTYTATATVHEAEMQVPYELVFDFDGVRKSLYGIWEGIAVSEAVFHVEKPIPHSA